MADTQDKGGLSYTITNKVDGLAELRQQRDLLREIRDSIAAIKSAGSTSTSKASPKDTGVTERRQQRNQESQEIKDAARDRRNAEKTAARDLVKAQKDADREVRREREADIRLGADALRRTRIEQEANIKQADVAASARQKESQNAERRVRIEREANIAQAGAALKAEEASKARQIKMTEKQLIAENNLANAAKRRISEATANGANFNDLSDREAVKNKLASVLPGSQLAEQMRKEQPSLRQRITDFLGLSKAHATAETSGGKLLFTFRRLFGVLALFTIVRQLNSKFFELVKTMVSLNANLEQSKIGIASLLLASGNVSDSLGNAAGSAYGLKIASKEASKQVALLRKDAIDTNTSFEALVETFQVALSPGLRAGLNVDEIRGFTVRIAQAARAIGLAQNQLAEEIRSILSGTIQARTTRIAVALGITNEDIRNAKAAGTLLPFLQKKFAAFAEAGAETAKTFDGLWNSFTTGLQIAMQSGGLPFFENVKSLLSQINALTVNRKDDIVKINPVLITFISQIAAGLSVAVDQARLLVQNLASNDIVRVGTLVGNSIGLASTAIRVLAEGVLTGLGNVLVLFNAISRVFSVFGAGIGSGLLVLLIRIATIIKIITFTLGLIPGVQGKIVLGKIISSVRSLGTNYSVVLSMAVGVLKNVKLLFTSTVLWSAAAHTVAGAFALILADVLGIIYGIDYLQKTKWGEGVTNSIAKTFVEAGVELKRFKAMSDLFIGKKIATTPQQITYLEKELQIAQEKYDFIKSKKGDALLEGVKTKTVLDEIKRGIAAINVMEFMPKSLDATNNAKTLVDEFSDLPGIISGTSDEIENASDATRKFVLDLAKANLDLKNTLDNLGSSDSAKSISNAMSQSVIDAFEQSQKLDERQAELESRRKRAYTDLDILQTRSVPSLPAEDQGRYPSILASERERLVNAAAFEKILEKIRDTTIDLKLAQIKTDDAAAEAVSKRLEGYISERDAIKAKMDAEDKSFNLMLGVTANREKIIDLVKNEIGLSGTIVHVGDELGKLSERRAGLEKEHVELLGVEIQKMTALQTLEASRELAAAKIEATQASRTIKLGPNARQSDLDMVNIDTDVALRTLESKKQKDLLAATGKSYEESYQKLKAMGVSAAVLYDVEKDQIVATDIIKQNISKQADELARVTEEQRIIYLKAATGAAVVGDQIRQSVAQMNKDLPTQFDQINTALTGAVEGFASFVSTSIADAFDPNNDKSIKERFASFLADLGKMILDFLIRIQIFKAVAGLMAFNTGGEVPDAAGYASGGRVYDPFTNARGYADGGATFGFRRPANLHPSDRIPIWAAAGEWIIKAKSAAKYGRNVMAAINEGLIDPLSLKSLASVAGGVRMATLHGPGYASGGSIAASAHYSPASALPAGNGRPLVAIVAPTREAADAIFKGGDAEFLDMIERNGAAVNRRLGRN